MHDDYQIVKLTKKYIVDFLNALCFSNTISWDGDDQFNEFPIFSTETEERRREEQRGALLVHNKYAWALRVLVTVIEDTKQQVCYRITGLKNLVKLDNPERVCVPFDALDIDFSIADLNLGMQEPSSYSFADNITADINRARIFSLLRFLLDSSLIASDDKELFEGLLIDTLSFPPFSGDGHYVPVYGVQVKE